MPHTWKINIFQVWGKENSKYGACMDKINLNISDKSKSDYRKLALNFYSKIKADGDSISLETITAKLIEIADNHTRGYWRKLRGAIAFDQLEKGYEKPAYIIKELVNTSTDPAPKQKRARKITDSDYQRLFKKSSKRLQHILTIAKITGARSCEYETIKCVGDYLFHITGAKKTHNRGADRVIKLNHVDSWRLNNAINSYQDFLSESKLKDPLGALRKELSKNSLKIWPKRKPLNYGTFRHQMGSDLKADDSISGKDKGYTLGHQVTQSIESYGNKANGTGANRINAGESSDAVRENSTSFDDMANDLASKMKP